MSKRTVEQMLEEARRRRELEAENEQRAKELEEARQLQLSMPPKNMPQLPHLEIVAYMKPATEVGGDYSDITRIGTESEMIFLLRPDDKQAWLLALMLATLTGIVGNVCLCYRSTQGYPRQPDHPPRPAVSAGFARLDFTVDDRRQRGDVLCDGQLLLLVSDVRARRIR